MEPSAELDLSDDPALEVSLRTWAIPVALVVARLLVASDIGHFFLRTFLSMWVHETGHAVAAWLCGFPAFPGPWLTATATARSPIFALLVAAAIGYAAFRAWQAERGALTWALAGLLCVQFFCTVLLRAGPARAFIYFAGDGGALVLGTLLMTTVYATGSIKRGWLRWGFLVIGAAAFADVFEQWWGARTDPDRIPFGANEGRGPSDPSVLSDQFGWSAARLVHSYVALGIVCLAALAVVYAVGLMRARARFSR
jgi:hypothetical protein